MPKKKKGKKKKKKKAGPKAGPAKEEEKEEIDNWDKKGWINVRFTLLMDEWPFTNFNMEYKCDHTLYYIQEEIKNRYGVIENLCIYYPSKNRKPEQLLTDPTLLLSKIFGT